MFPPGRHTALCNRWDAPLYANANLFSRPVDIHSFFTALFPLQLPPGKSPSHATAFTDPLPIDHQPKSLRTHLATPWDFLELSFYTANVLLTRIMQQTEACGIRHKRRLRNNVGLSLLLAVTYPNPKS